MQHAGIADIGPYNERLESTHVVESAVVPNVDIPISAPGSYCLGMAFLRWSVLAEGV